MKKYLSISFLLRFGLACAFLANSLTAFLSPDDFKEIISGSFLAKILPVSLGAFVVFVGVNDLIVALLLLIKWKVSKVAIWASIWIIGVIFVLGIGSIDAMEHVAFLCLALTLVLHSNNE